MKTLKTVFSSRFEEKKSVFLAHLAPIDEHKKLLLDLRSEHPKARHFVQAVRFFDENNILCENFNDDGEPKKTSGYPMLNAIRGADLVNVCAITVRYFGGIKLGTGGLVRAYSASINQTIELSELVEFVHKKRQSFFIKHKDISRFLYQTQRLSVDLERKNFTSQGLQCVCLGTKEAICELENMPFTDFRI